MSRVVYYRETAIRIAEAQQIAGDLNGSSDCRPSLSSYWITRWKLRLRRDNSLEIGVWSTRMKPAKSYWSCPNLRCIMANAISISNAALWYGLCDDDPGGRLRRHRWTYGYDQMPVRKPGNPNNRDVYPYEHRHLRWQARSMPQQWAITELIAAIIIRWIRNTIRMYLYT